MKVLCPHASKCWKGGGSYKCAYNPPFCDKPLIPKEPGKAKEKLYAAAPDMYEALEAAVSEYGKPGGPWNVPSEPGTWIDKARAALAKARGEKIPQPVEEKQEELW